MTSSRTSRIKIACLLLAACCALPACAAKKEEAASAAAPTTTPTMTKTAQAAPAPALGSDAWGRGSCTLCHGSDGTGGPLGPDLTDDEWVNCDGTVEGIRAVLKKGVALADMDGRSYPSPMPPATDLIKKDEEIEALAAYVRELSSADQ